MEEKDTKLEFWTLRDVEEILQIGRIAALALFKSKEFPGLKLGRRYRVEKKAFEKWCSKSQNMRFDYSFNKGGRK